MFVNTIHILDIIKFETVSMELCFIYKLLLYPRFNEVEVFSIRLVRPSVRPVKVLQFHHSVATCTRLLVICIYEH